MNWQYRVTYSLWSRYPRLLHKAVSITWFWSLRTNHYSTEDREGKGKQGVAIPCFCRHAGGRLEVLPALVRRHWIEGAVQSKVGVPQHHHRITSRHRTISNQLTIQGFCQFFGTSYPQIAPTSSTHWYPGGRFGGAVGGRGRGADPFAGNQLLINIKYDWSPTLVFQIKESTFIRLNYDFYVGTSSINIDQTWLNVLEEEITLGYIKRH